MISWPQENVRSLDTFPMLLDLCNLNFFYMFCRTALQCKWISTPLTPQLIKSLTLHWVWHTPLFHPLCSSILSKYGMESRQSQQDSPGFKKQNLKEIADIWLSCFTNMPKFRNKQSIFITITRYNTGADLGGGCRGCAPPPWDDLQFSNTTGILQKKNYVAYWCRSRAREGCTPSCNNWNQCLYNENKFLEEFVWTLFIIVVMDKDLFIAVRINTITLPF